MILPDRNIAPDRALLTIGGLVFDRLAEPKTASRLWDEIREAHRRRPISYVWFLLAVDLLFTLNLAWFDQDGLLKRQVQQEPT
ncbi:MAG TPA: ABC-three component system middle component 6 [Roseiarcus sp.]|nr:ABC-three component system middle component 6 [Roseiarcus sp.]